MGIAIADYLGNPPPRQLQSAPPALLRYRKAEVLVGWLPAFIAATVAILAGMGGATWSARFEMIAILSVVLVAPCALLARYLRKKLDTALFESNSLLVAVKEAQPISVRDKRVVVRGTGFLLHDSRGGPEHWLWYRLGQEPACIAPGVKLVALPLRSRLLVAVGDSLALAHLRPPGPVNSSDRSR